MVLALKVEFLFSFLEDDYCIYDLKENSWGQSVKEC